MARSGSCPVTAQQTSGGGFRFRRFRAAWNRLWVEPIVGCNLNAPKGSNEGVCPHQVCYGLTVAKRPSYNSRHNRFHLPKRRNPPPLVCWATFAKLPLKNSNLHLPTSESLSATPSSLHFKTRQPLQSRRALKLLSNSATWRSFQIHQSQSLLRTSLKTTRQPLFMMTYMTLCSLSKIL